MPPVHVRSIARLVALTLMVCRGATAAQSPATGGNARPGTGAASAAGQVDCTAGWTFDAQGRTYKDGAGQGGLGDQFACVGGALFVHGLDGLWYRRTDLGWSNPSKTLPGVPSHTSAPPPTAAPSPAASPRSASNERSAAPQPSAIPVPSNDQHPYFAALVARADHWKSNPLRSQALIDSVSSFRPNTAVTYDPTMDAAKAVVPAFQDVGYNLGAPLTAGADRMVLAAPLGTREQNRFVNGRGILIDDEVVTARMPGEWGTQFPDASTVLIARTRPAAHQPGAAVKLSNNSLENYLAVPLGTEDGHSYLITWDVRYDASYLGADNNSDAIGRKEFQLTAGTRPRIWLETRTRADGQDGRGNVGRFDRSRYVAVIDARYYDWIEVIGARGSNMKSRDSLAPQAGRFFVQANKWTRFWWLIDQKPGLSPVTLWVADEDTAPVKIFDAVTVGVFDATISQWWLEQNSSFDLYRGARRDLVSYVRNFAALRDPADVPEVLTRP